MFWAFSGFNKRPTMLQVPGVLESGLICVLTLLEKSSIGSGIGSISAAGVSTGGVGVGAGASSGIGLIVLMTSGVRVQAMKLEQARASKMGLRWRITIAPS